MAEKMSSKTSYLSKNLVLLSLSTFVPKLLSLVLIPIYANYLTQAEYGVADLIETTVSLLVPVFTMTIYDAVLRFSMNKDYDQSEVFTNAIKIVFAGTALVGAAAFVVSRFHIEAITNTYLIIVVVSFFFCGMYNVVTRFCRAIDKVKLIALSGGINSTILLVCNILFLVVFGWGLNGYLLVHILASALPFLMCFFGARLYRYLKPKRAKALMARMIAFSAPMIFSAIAWWINNASDRYILTWMCGVAVSGVFAFSNKIPSLLSLVQTVFNQAWSISAIAEFDPEDEDGFLGNVYTSLVAVMALACSFLMIVNLPLAKVLYGTEFFEAWKYVPPLLAAAFFNALALYMDGLFLAVSQTKTISACTVLGAVVNTVLNFLLIYFWGAYGAALATMIGFGVGYLVRAFLLKKYVRLKVNSVKTCLTLVLLLAQVAISWLEWRSLYIQPALFLAIALLYWRELKNMLVMIFAKIFKRDRRVQ